ncbi:MAG: ATP-dependent DNA helicase RecG [Candidatus Buchananbacteria bacterium]
MLKLDSAMAELPRIGQALTAKLNKLGIRTVQDLIFYFPFRYDDFSQITTVKNLTVGQTVTIKAKVELIQSRRSFRQHKIIIEGLVTDETGSLKVIWFNQPWIAKNLQAGEMVYLSGKLTGDLFSLQLVNPVYEKLATEQTHTARIVPVYSVTESLTVKQLRYLLRQVWPLAKMVPDFLPLAIKQELKLAARTWALAQIHFPDNWANLQAARRRLKFDELFYWQLQGQYSKEQLKKISAAVVPFNLKLVQTFINNLPFTLTDDQKKAAWQIIQDLETAQATSRLLLGEVGSGKTVVAAVAALNCFAAGYQAAIMAPTEILANQHFLEFCKLYQDQTKLLPVRIALLTSKSVKFNQVPAITRAALLTLIKKGQVDLVIGTQALLATKVKFKQLALAIVDEQHRFGVAQRQILKAKKSTAKIPHFLSLSATPIPRSLALAIYADLEISLIKQLPQERKKVITKIVSEAKRVQAYDFIKQQIQAGRQVYVICPIIDPSDVLGVKSVTTEYQRLTKEVFAEFKVGLVHGRLKAEQKNKVMQEFADRQLDILVATSVIEVGINVPNATVIVIEGAERFGLAQLHQLRGRVGRGEEQAYCLLFTEEAARETLTRLQAVVESNDGFALAQKDLALRGPGEIYGIEQSGFWQLKLATLADGELIKLAREQAAKLIKQDPTLDSYPEILAKLKQSAVVHWE